MLNIILGKFAAESMPSYNIRSKLATMVNKRGWGGGRNFFSFNSFATSLDNSTHLRTIELAKFGKACDNVIIPAAVYFFLSFFAATGQP